MWRYSGALFSVSARANIYISSIYTHDSTEGGIRDLIFRLGMSLTLNKLRIVDIGYFGSFWRDFGAPNVAEIRGTGYCRSVFWVFCNSEMMPFSESMTDC